MEILAEARALKQLGVPDAVLSDQAVSSAVTQ